MANKNLTVIPIRRSFLLLSFSTKLQNPLIQLPPWSALLWEFRDTRDKTCLNSLSNTNISLYRMEEEWLSGLRLHQTSGQNYQRKFLILNWHYLQLWVKGVSNTTSRIHENHFSPRADRHFSNLLREVSSGEVITIPWETCRNNFSC